MASVDTQKNLLVTEVLPPQVLTGDTAITGTAVDMNGDNGDFESVTFALSVSAYTDGEFGITVMESDNGTDWTAADLEDVLGGVQMTVAAIDTVGYVGDMRYVTCAVAVAGATTGATISCLAIQGNDRQKRTV